MPTRAEHERSELGELAERAGWLSGLSWRFNGLLLEADFDLQVGDEQIGLRITYPEYFPNSPPSIMPRDQTDVRLSSHQWGVGGELCLERRADNWSPDVTGAVMVQSAYTLLSGEAEHPDVPVPSAHNFTQGQEVRGEAFRLIVTADIEASLAGLQIGDAFELEYVDIRYASIWTAQVTVLKRGEENFFEQEAFAAYDRTIGKGFGLRVPDAVRLPAKPSAEKFRQLVAGTHIEEWLNAAGEASTGVLLVGRLNKVFYLVYKTADGSFMTISYKAVDVDSAGGRLPAEYEALAGKKVGIVGCGSLGSKIAVSLARAGIKEFLVIDADLFHPANVVRNALPMRAVGTNKAKAVQQAVREVNASIEVGVRTILLGRQESAESAGGALRRLGECDLIIDATAEADVFNLCAMVCQAEKKPLVWGAVYAGGIGGLVARARPAYEPPPLFARNQIRAWYNAKAVPWIEGEQRNYEVAPNERPPLVADDSDVSVIAAHLTKLALDTLARPDASIFPHSAYCVGLATSWIFAAPFDTWPIDFSNEGTWGPPSEEDGTAKAVAFMNSVLGIDEGTNEG